MLVINKPAGLVVHPGAGNAAGTLENGLLAHDPALAGLPRSGILHRLDKDTSGLLIVAKTLTAHTHLVRDLEAREITREYRALCVGAMTAGGSVDADIGRHKTQRTKMSVTDFGGRRGGHPLPGARPASRTTPSLPCASRPAAPTRSACTWPTCAIPSWAIPPTAAG